VSLLARPSDAIWSQAGAIAIMAPCAWIGGLLAGRTLSGGRDIGRVRPLR
jgi:hypothetical protein